ncbi:UNVERIFIED_CONTAM: hypothetical protein K2H54_014521 [Gekko kuhli]
MGKNNETPSNLPKPLPKSPSSFFSLKESRLEVKAVGTERAEMADGTFVTQLVETVLNKQDLPSLIERMEFRLEDQTLQITQLGNYKGSTFIAIDKDSGFDLRQALKLSDDSEQSRRTQKRKLQFPSPARRTSKMAVLNSAPEMETELAPLSMVPGLEDQHYIFAC